MAIAWASSSQLTGTVDPAMCQKLLSWEGHSSRSWYPAKKGVDADPGKLLLAGGQEISGME